MLSQNFSMQIRLLERKFGFYMSNFKSITKKGPIIALRSFPHWNRLVPVFLIEFSKRAKYSNDLMFMIIFYKIDLEILYLNHGWIVGMVWLFYCKKEHWYVEKYFLNFSKYCSMQLVPCSLLNTFQTVIHLINMMTLWYRSYYCLYLEDDEIKV